MNFYKSNATDGSAGNWPSGAVPWELDSLESFIKKIETGEFETQYKNIIKEPHPDQEKDYIILLRLERSIYKGKIGEDDELLFADFISRRGHVPRVLFSFVRYLVSIDKSEEAEQFLQSNENIIIGTADYHFLKALLAYKQKDAIEWWRQCKEAILHDAGHRETICFLGQVEMCMQISLGSLSYIENYLAIEPFDIPIRNLYEELLLKYGLIEQAHEQKQIINLFLQEERA